MSDIFQFEKHTFADVENKFENYIHNKEDIQKIRKAFEYASSKHANQFRKSGEPYIVHIIEVAYILATLNAGPSTLIAGILHDVVEDCDVCIEEISELFTSEIATLVESLTKIKALSKRKDKEFLANLIVRFLSQWLVMFVLLSLNLLIDYIICVH